MITDGLGLLGIVATGGGVAAQLTTDRAAVDTQLPADLSLADAQVIAGVWIWYRWVWVSCRYPMLCITLAGEPRRVPALALLLPPW